MILILFDSTDITAIISDVVNIQYWDIQPLVLLFGICPNIMNYSAEYHIQNHEEKNA